jgi:hypothetical protein
MRRRSAALCRAATRCLLSVLSAPLCACSLFSGAISLEVKIPPPPEHWRESFPELVFTLLYPDENGCLREVLVPDWSCPMTVTCSKRSNAPLLAYPWDGAVSTSVPRAALKPAGGIWPLGVEQDNGRGVLELQWEDGPAAEVIRGLWEAGMDTGLVNAERLAASMRECEDPWRWDVIGIEGRLASGDFDVYDIDPLPREDVIFAAPDGDWISEDPFRAVIRPDSEGFLTLKDLPYGRHTLFGRDDARIEIYLDERGLVTMTAAPD